MSYRATWQSSACCSAVPSQPRRLIPRPRPATSSGPPSAGDENAIIAAIEKGADVNARNQYGITTWDRRQQGGQPAVERRRIAQARELSPRCQERILGRVCRVGVVGQDRPREAVAAVDPRIDEDPKRRRIAGAGATNEHVVGRRLAVVALVRALISPSGHRS